jgi:sugar phosphate isomerase/epimerase
MTRRTLVGALAAASAAGVRGQTKEWKPKLGVLGPFTEKNVAFARQEGFTNMILGGDARSTLNAETITDEAIMRVKATLAAQQMHVSALQVTQNHISTDAAERARENSYFVKAIELAGKLGVPYIGTCSGKDPTKPFQTQVNEIVRTYNEKYFPSCEKNHVRILWEPWPGGPNLAVSPVGFEALFKGFGDAPYVGLQYDPSHLVWQMMDPIQTARDFVDKIYDVHLKDTEVRWDILHGCGINPVNGAKWWSYRLPGLGSIQWAEFFTVLQRAGYTGAMSIEHEDALYGADHTGAEFTPDFETGFKMAHRYLRQYVPE